MKKPEYPQISKLGLKINDEPCSHISFKELKKVLKKKGILKKFNEYFGVQTGLVLDDGDLGLYCWDVEATLERIFSGKLIGSQKNWD